jgi:TonB family protein
MTLWLSNLAAFSVQLAVLVGTGAVILRALRLQAPRATLWFWQVLFAASAAWPLYQLLRGPDSSPEVLAGGVLWTAFVSNGAVPGADVSPMVADLAMLIVPALAVGAVARLAWLGLGFTRLQSIRNASIPAEGLSSIALPLQQELGVTADIRFSDDITSPATLGARRPIVLLPPAVRTLAPAVQRALVCHELIHVQRRDWALTFLEELWCGILWFHPFARMLASRLSLARETVVDAAVIAHTHDRRAYAAALLAFATARPWPGATALIGRRQLEQRIALIVQEASMPRSSLFVRLTVALGAVAITTIAATAHVPLSATLHAQADKVYKPREDRGIVVPRVISDVKPTYTAGAMQAKIQGTVLLAAVVLANGDVGEVTVTQSLDTEHGLDQQAIDAVRQWKFEPGTKDGKPVAVEVVIEMTFTLKK